MVVYYKKNIYIIIKCVQNVEGLIEGQIAVEIQKDHIVKEILKDHIVIKEHFVNNLYEDQIVSEREQFVERN